MTRKQISKADLLIALRQAESERDAWRNVYLNPDPDFKLEVSIPQHDRPYAAEEWSLHAAHRADGGTLRIVDTDGHMRVHSLAAIPESMRAAINACPYRRSALVKVEAASAEFARKLYKLTHADFDHPDLDLRGVGK